MKAGAVANAPKVINGGSFNSASDSSNEFFNDGSNDCSIDNYNGSSNNRSNESLFLFNTFLM